MTLIMFVEHEDDYIPTSNLQSIKDETEVWKFLSTYAQRSSMYTHSRSRNMMFAHSKEQGNAQLPTARGKTGREERSIEHHRPARSPPPRRRYLDHVTIRNLCRHGSLYHLLSTRCAIVGKVSINHRNSMLFRVMMFAGTD